MSRSILSTTDTDKLYFGGASDFIELYQLNEVIESGYRCYVYDPFKDIPKTISTTKQ